MVGVLDERKSIWSQKSNILLEGKKIIKEDWETLTALENLHRKGSHKKVLRFEIQKEKGHCYATGKWTSAFHSKKLKPNVVQDIFIRSSI